MVDIYDLKANITTILCVVLLPILSAKGMDSITANSLIGAVSYFIALFIVLYGEKYISKFLTVPRDDVEDLDGSDFEES